MSCPVLRDLPLPLLLRLEAPALFPAPPLLCLKPGDLLGPEDDLAEPAVEIFSGSVSPGSVGVAVTFSDSERELTRGREVVPRREGPALVAACDVFTLAKALLQRDVDTLSTNNCGQ